MVERCTADQCLGSGGWTNTTWTKVDRPGFDSPTVSVGTSAGETASGRSAGMSAGAVPGKQSAAVQQLSERRDELLAEALLVEVLHDPAAGRGSQLGAERR